MKSDKQQFDFCQGGKQMPYRTPDGYFEQSAQQLKDLVVAKPKYNYSSRWWYGVAATLLLACAVYGLTAYISYKSDSRVVPVYSQNADNAGEWNDFAESDLFLDNMDW